jgi:hypothetical protein
MAFAALLLVLAPLLFFTGYLIKQKIIQHQMKEQLENASLQTVTVNKVAITWVKKNKEAIVDGKLFDVKFYTVAGNKIILRGLFDAVENKLKKDFVSLMHSKRNQSAPLEQLILKLIFTAATNQNQEIKIFACNQITKKTYSFYNEAAVYQSAAIASPPPNV